MYNIKKKNLSFREKHAFLKLELDLNLGFYFSITSHEILG